MAARVPVKSQAKFKTFDEQMVEPTSVYRCDIRVHCTVVTLSPLCTKDVERPPGTSSLLYNVYYTC